MSLILAGVLVAPGPVLAGGGVALADGAGSGGLRLGVVVNGRQEAGARPVPVRAGAEVVKRYLLVNRGGADLYEVRVGDPGLPAGVAVRCPRRTLVGLTSMECRARFRALPGVRTATVRAEGRIPSLGLTSTATGRGGYTGVTASLALRERVRVAPPSRPATRALGAGTAAATVTYTVTNGGNRALHDVRVTDPALRLSGAGLDCGGRPGVVPVLAPGASAECAATVRRPAGTHRSTGLATGTDRVPTYAPGGLRLAAPLLTARAGASFTVPAPAPEPTREPVREPVRAGGPAGLAPGGASAAPARPRPAPGPPGNAAAPVPPPAAVLPSGPPGPEIPPAAGAPGAAAGTAGAGAAAPGVAAPGGVAAGPGADGGADGGIGAEAGEGAGGGGMGSGPGTGSGSGQGTGSGSDSGEAAGGEGGGGTGGTGGAGEVPAGGLTPPEAVRRAAAGDDEGFLGRVRRRGREAEEMGVVVMLLLILMPAALAAALLGNRRS
ncbi:hypothetical protein GCM10010363_24120 [Streptomyces omiyaensis]|uniref:DUF7507 domain-containing protein n=1 Tax=Streptomyces omiyaensis TaxID=68247 RepID=UPI0016740DA9|nr:hypothetical protein [Streptomyces omiyaensis]GGY42654.1 hypothetical protein GCM10010363_24120 [Streptomyces omiyaensis]